MEVRNGELPSVFPFGHKHNMREMEAISVKKGTYNHSRLQGCVHLIDPMVQPIFRGSFLSLHCQAALFVSTRQPRDKSR